MDTEINIKNLEHFKTIDLDLRFNNSVKYASLKKELSTLKEKCIKSSTKNCSSCIESIDKSCLMKMFKYIEPKYSIEPHKGSEYSDVSFSTKLDGVQKIFKIIMKSNKDKNVTAATAAGKEISNQIITQYMRDAYKPILGILVTPSLDRADIINLIKLVNGQVIFIEEEELIGIALLAKDKGFSLS